MDKLGRPSTSFHLRPEKVPVAGDPTPPTLLLRPDFLGQERPLWVCSLLHKL